MRRALFKYLAALRAIWAEPSNHGQRLFRVFVSILWKLNQLLLGVPVIVRLDNGNDYIALPRADNSTGVIHTRIYDSAYISFCRAHIPHGGHLVDVGANTGLYTLLLSKCFTGGFCFEPNPETHHLLRRNLALNELNTYEAVPFAASDTAGESDFATEGSYSCVAHLAQCGEMPSPRTAPPNITVNTVTLDAFLSSRRSLDTVTFLKIDTEGHELAVLKGARRLLTSSPTLLVQCENGSDEASQQYLKSLGYLIFCLNKNGLPTTTFSALRNALNYYACLPCHPCLSIFSD